MSTSTRKLSLFWVITLFLAAAGAVMMADGWFLSEAVQGAQQPRGEAQLDLLVSIPVLIGGGDSPTAFGDILEELRGLREFSVDSFFDVAYTRVYSNLGSSGLDGARFSVDSFFDVELFGDPDFGLFGDPDFDIFGDPDFDLFRISALGTLTDPSNPGRVLDEVDLVLKGHKHHGHITVLK